MKPFFFIVSLRNFCRRIWATFMDLNWRRNRTGMCYDVLFIIFFFLFIYSIFFFFFHFPLEFLLLYNKGPSGKDRRPWDWSCWQKRVTTRRFSVFTPDRRPQPLPPPLPRHLTLPGAIQLDRISTPYLPVSPIQFNQKTLHRLLLLTLIYMVCYYFIWNSRSNWN